MHWIDLINYTSKNFNYDTQEIAKVQLLELYPEDSEVFAEDMSDTELMEINETQTLKELKIEIENNYNWALKVDFEKKDNNFLFWYISAAKLEPRLGERYNEDGSELEQNLGVAKMVNNLYSKLSLKIICLLRSILIFSNSTLLYCYLKCILNTSKDIYIL